MKVSKRRKGKWADVPAVSTAEVALGTGYTSESIYQLAVNMARGLCVGAMEQRLKRELTEKERAKLTEEETQVLPENPDDTRFMKVTYYYRAKPHSVATAEAFFTEDQTLLVVRHQLYETINQK